MHCLAKWFSFLHALQSFTLAGHSLPCGYFSPQFLHWKLGLALPGLQLVAVRPVGCTAFTDAATLCSMLVACCSDSSNVLPYSRKSSRLLSGSLSALLRSLVEMQLWINCALISWRTFVISQFFASMRSLVQYAFRFSPGCCTSFQNIYT